MRVRFSLLLLLATISGCANSLSQEMQVHHFYASPPLPRASIDVEASEVQLVGGFQPEGPEGCTNCVNELRKQLATAIETFLDTDTLTSQARLPGRFRLRGKIETIVWAPSICAVAPYLFIPFTLGAPCGKSEAEVILELQIGDQRWLGRSEATVWTGFYYNALPNIEDGELDRMVLGRATAWALRDIVQQAAKPAAEAGR